MLAGDAGIGIPPPALGAPPDAADAAVVDVAAVIPIPGLFLLTGIWLLSFG